MGRGHGLPYDISGMAKAKFSEISDNISETVQDRDIVAMEDKQKIIYWLFNGMIVNDLE